jgi:hypothetical protein
MRCWNQNGIVDSCHAMLKRSKTPNSVGLFIAAIPKDYSFLL